MVNGWDFQLSTQTIFTGEINIKSKYNYTQYNQIINCYICVGFYDHGCVRCYGNASTRKRLNTEMPKKSGNPSKTVDTISARKAEIHQNPVFEGFPLYFEAFPKIFEGFPPFT